MKTNTRLLFKFLLRRCQIDCVCDIGSRDGFESTLFRQVLPEARILAFEANPVLFKKMKENQTLRNDRIEVLPYAISNKTGTASFHVPDVDYDDKDANKGLGSLLEHQNVKIRESVEVPMRRIDELLLSTYPGARNVALWIDAEGVEYFVLEGMSGIKDRVAAIHVETARISMRVGQKVYAEVETLLNTMNFVPVGTSMTDTSDWGDVVFANRQALARLGFRFHLCQAVGWLSYWCRANFIGGLLKDHCHPLYQVLSRAYVKLFT